MPSERRESFGEVVDGVERFFRGVAVCNAADVKARACVLVASIALGRSALGGDDAAEVSARDALAPAVRAYWRAAQAADLCDVARAELASLGLATYTEVS